MVPSFSAQSDGENIRVYASEVSTFFVEAGDTLTASAGGATVMMEPSVDDGLFSATLPQPAGVASVLIAYLRPSGEVSAPRSTVTLADPFQLATRLPEGFRRGDSFTVALSPMRSPLPQGQGRMSIAFEGSCMPDPFTDAEYPLTLDLPFTGSVVFDTSVVAFANESVGPFDCDVTIHIRAETVGDLDPAFAPGAYEGLQEQTALSHITR